MNIESMKIAWACFLGSIVGIITARIISPMHPYWMPVGFLVGGFLGYLAYDFREVLEESRQVWRDLVDLNEIRRSWREFKDECSPIVRQVSGVGSVILCFLAIICLWVCGISSGFGSEIYWTGLNGNVVEEGFHLLPQSRIVSSPFVVLVGLSLATILLTAFMRQFCQRILDWSIVDPIYDHAEDQKALDIFLLIMLCGMPGIVSILLPLLGVALVLLCAALVVCVFAIVLWACAKAVKTLCTWGWRVFCIVHSEERLICATDTVLGALGGYWLGKDFALSSPEFVCTLLVGGILGALLGVLNYELVSIRWLKLVPKTA